MKNKTTAWYLDEDILLEGKVINNRFYPNTNMYGFRVQEFDKSMIDKEIFFELEKAFSICGDIPVIKDDGYYSKQS